MVTANTSHSPAGGLWQSEELLCITSSSNLLGSQWARHRITYIFTKEEAEAGRLRSSLSAKLRKHRVEMWTQLCTPPVQSMPSVRKRRSRNQPQAVLQKCCFLHTIIVFRVGADHTAHNLVTYSCFIDAVTLKPKGLVSELTDWEAIDSRSQDLNTKSLLKAWGKCYCLCEVCTHVPLEDTW